jgi:Na+/H+-dicarboxylate symporter
MKLSQQLMGFQRSIAFFKNLPVQLVCSILLASALSKTLTPVWIRYFYTISTLFVDLLMMALPIIVFIYILAAIVGMDRRSPWMIGLIFGAVTLSNATALFLAYVVGQITLPFFTLPDSSHLIHQLQSTITPLFCIHSPITIGTDKAMLAGIILGLLTLLMSHTRSISFFIKKTSFKMRDLITALLQRFFIPLLPFYVFGFSLKMACEGSLHFLVTTYAQVFLLSLTVVIVYLALLFLLAANGRLNQALKFVRTALPAGITGFSTMSSAVTMPVTLDCARQNLRDEHFPELIVPATANIHMLGDDLTIVLTALSLLLMNGQALPDLAAFLPFAGAFCIAKLSCVGIPGASVLVVLPVLQHYLGFSPEMISMLTTIYILQDPMGTAANVMGNSAFVLILKKLSTKIFKR